MQKGMSVDVYRNAHGYDTTRDGISSEAKSFLLVGEGVAEVFSEHPDTPTMYLIKRVLWGKQADYICPDKDGMYHNGYMFGGNFAYSSDSRFPSKQPIPIHDRQE